MGSFDVLLDDERTQLDAFVEEGTPQRPRGDPQREGARNPARSR